MKYVVILGDGMADEPIGELGGRTPLEACDTPMMDELAKVSEIGLAAMIPEGMKPGSDTANLAVLGYDPKKYYTGRSPLEALSIGVPMEDTDIAIRCNLVTLSDDGLPYGEKVILDHSSGEITTKEGEGLIEAVREEFEDGEYKFYAGISYRHLVIWKNGVAAELTPPHDILGKAIGEYLPDAGKLGDFMRRSYGILNSHPINAARAEKGLNKANSLWFWGAGTRPRLDSFYDKFHKKGAMISAVDLLKGIAVGTGMKVVDVEGADGTLETNYEGKAKACTDALLKDGFDFAYVHLEAPDEMGHQGSVERKMKSISYLDGRIIRPVFETLSGSGTDFKMLVLPDHPTPVRVRTHTSDPVPYMLYDSTDKKSWNLGYCEKAAAESGRFFKEGYRLMRHFLG